MKGTISIFLLFSLSYSASAQYKVTFVLKEKTEIRRDNVFITGSFNNWDSAGNPKYKLINRSGDRAIVLNLPAGEIRYKYSGGDWLSVEKRWDADELPDRKFNIKKDTIVVDTVSEWRDFFLKNKHTALSKQVHDTVKLVLLGTLAQGFAFNSEWYNVDSSLYYIRQTVALLEKIKASNELKSWPAYASLIITSQEVHASVLHSLGNFTKSLELRLENLKLAHDYKLPIWEFNTVMSICDDYIAMKDYSNALDYCKRGEALLYVLRPGYESLIGQGYVYYRQAICRVELGPPDSALNYTRQLHALGKKNNVGPALAISNQLLGDHFRKLSNTDSAYSYYRSSLFHAYYNNMFHIAVLAQKGMVNLFMQIGKLDSALLYARGAINNLNERRTQIQAWSENAQSYLADISPVIAELYQKKNQPDSAYKYLKLSVQLKDSLYDVNKVRQFQNLTFNESIRREEELRKEKEARQDLITKIKIYGLIFGLALLLLVVIILYRSYKQKRQANEVLETQKNQIEQTLQELKMTQAQLIQSAKMASLGELTAGIAHEIQNPLNFVNNFAEINRDLVEELKKGRSNGERNADTEMEILDTLLVNEAKIIQHGKRADSIVKGMLYHSRTGTGQKEPTDINTLAEEYLQLAYHGFRSTEKGISVALKTDFDKNIRKILVIPQDIGRVLLNLYNNAFHALSTREGSGAPTVTVRTKKENGKVFISVKDNGPGIPANILDKIFHPFFTTKTTGGATGLGLSLSYDVIRAHGGELKVDTKPGEGAEFVIELPV